jgi:hypothetical protein
LTGKTIVGFLQLLQILLKNIISQGWQCTTCNPSTGETEAGGSQVQGQPGLQNKMLSQEISKKPESFLLQLFSICIL